MRTMRTEASMPCGRKASSTHGLAAIVSRISWCLSCLSVRIWGHVEMWSLVDIVEALIVDLSRKRRCVEMARYIMLLGDKVHLCTRCKVRVA